MTILPLVVGDLRTNCYLVSDPSTNKCLIIDPADEGDFISTTILENKLIPEAIILTHGHYDHCLATLELKLNFNIPIYLHKEDLFLYQNATKSANFWSPSLRHSSLSSLRTPPKAVVWQSHSTIPPLPPIDFYLENNQTISFGDSSLKVIHTPGHTPGSICLSSSSVIASPAVAGRGNLIPNVLFTGDTLFANGVGRTDLSYSSKSDLKKSLKKLSSLPDSTLIYPGHEDYEVYLPTFLPK